MFLVLHGPTGERALGFESNPGTLDGETRTAFERTAALSLKYGLPLSPSLNKLLIAVEEPSEVGDALNRLCRSGETKECR